MRHLRDGIEWLAVGVSLVVQAGVIVALAYLADPPADPAARLRLMIEYGVVALAFLATGGGAFYLAVRRIRAGAGRSGGGASVSARPRQNA